jgi:hypothetical protein
VAAHVTQEVPVYPDRQARGGNGAAELIRLYTEQLGEVTGTKALDLVRYEKCLRQGYLNEGYFCKAEWSAKK